MDADLDLPHTTRRKFLHDLSLASVSAITLSLLTGGCESWIDSIRHRPTRRMIRNTTEANHQIDLYRDAVAQMQGLKTTDARNWTQQAYIHNNFCPHGNWFFFPWHRAYLFHFEKICQKLTGDKQFGLPYWNWGLDGHLPAPFWPPPAGNSLYDSTRVCTAASVADPGNVGLSLIDGYCNEPNFTLFAGGTTTGLRTGGGSYGNIEGTPHNYIHGTFVLGDMGTFMSPLDAIFWNHHCMVDLCWFEWNITRRHPNTADTAWTNFNLSGFFCDADGNPAADMPLWVTELMPLLSYQYETGIAGTAAPLIKAVSAKRDFERMQDIVKKGANVSLEIKQRFSLQRGLDVTVQRPAAAMIPVKTQDFAQVFTSNLGDRALLIVGRLAQPARSDVFLRVFIDKSDADAKTPRDDPHYAGSFYFFVHGGNMSTMNSEEMRNDLIVDITPTLRRLHSSALDSITISLVAVPAGEGTAPDTSFSVGDLEIVVSPLNVRLMEY
jgi:tyrosinase